MKKEISHILVYRLGSLGDTIMALPAFHLIRERFPDAQITLLTNYPVSAKAVGVAQVLGENGYFINDVIKYPAGSRHLLSILQLLIKIRKRKFDLLVHLTASRGKAADKRDARFFRLCGISQRIGLPPAAITDHENTAGVRQWEAEKLVRRISMPGQIDLRNDRYWDLKLTTEELQQATGIVRQFSSRIIAISPGTKVQAKDWGEENWTKLMGKLSATFGDLPLVILGSSDEYEKANRITAGWPGPVTNLCGHDVRVMSAVVRSALLFVGHDSGPMHLAAAAGVPCVAIFSARNLPVQWFPRGNHNTIIYHQTECAGCNLEVCVEQNKKCITSITVDEVYDAVAKKVSNTRILHENT